MGVLEVRAVRIGLQMGNSKVINRFVVLMAMTLKNRVDIVAIRCIEGSVMN